MPATGAGQYPTDQTMKLKSWQCGRQGTLKRLRGIVSTLGLGGKGKGLHWEISDWQAYQLTCAPFGRAVTRYNNIEYY